MDKDKLFLIVYANVGNMPEHDVHEHVEQIASALSFDESVEKLIIPVRGQETRVECINPVLLDEELYKKVEKKIKKLNKEVSNALNTLKDV